MICGRGGGGGGGGDGGGGRGGFWVLDGVWSLSVSHSVTTTIPNEIEHVTFMVFSSVIMQFFLSSKHGVIQVSSTHLLIYSFTHSCIILIQHPYEPKYGVEEGGRKIFRSYACGG